MTTRKGMNNSNFDKSRFLSHLSANNAVASKSRNLRRSLSYSSSHRYEAEGSITTESVDDKTHCERIIAQQQHQQQQAGLQSICLTDEDKESIALTLLRIRSSEKGIGKWNCIYRNHCKLLKITAEEML